MEVLLIFSCIIGSPAADHSAHDQSSPPGTTLTPQQRAARKQPWEHTEEIMSVLKTAFPLLALSMETVVDQIQKYFKCPSDEDAYRLIVALLNDGLSVRLHYPVVYLPRWRLLILPSMLVEHRARTRKGSSYQGQQNPTLLGLHSIFFRRIFVRHSRPTLS